MIIKMKRITVLGLKSHTETIIDQLQNTGLVHITHITPPESPKLEQIADKIFLAEVALQKIPNTDTKQSEPADVDKTVEWVFKTSEEQDSIDDEIGILELEEKRISFLGDFNPDEISELEKKGVFIDLYEIPRKKLNNNNTYAGNIVYHYLGESIDNIHVIAVISYKNRTKPDLEKFDLPRVSPKQLKENLKTKRDEYKKLDSQIAGCSQYYSSINRHLSELKSQLDFEQVRCGVGSDEKVVYLRGYCPVNKLALLKDCAIQNKWGILIEDPPKGESPPTLVQNPAWIRIINPVFRLLNTVPGYRELDISAVFLVFFSIFFGMLIGDAGYGVLFLAATAFAQIKFGNKIRQKDPFYLMYILSTVTILWGAVTGNWFGVFFLSQIIPFNLFIIPQLNAYEGESQDLVMSISFYIAAIHLSIAHIMVIFKNISLGNLLSNTGWVLMVWVMFFIAQNQVLGRDFPWFFIYLIITAVLLIFVFSFLERSPEKGISELLIADIILATINTFADTISYIRLFAVGLATLAVAQSFNEIATGIGFGNIISGLGSALILVTGHALNIALAAMAVIVHGIRLNMLEFSGHVGNTWSGYKYNPFRKRTVANR
jgi:V/A-type H+-transporting ATPase subunit I